MPTAPSRFVLGTVIFLLAGQTHADHMPDYEYIRRYLQVSHGVRLDTNGDGRTDALAYDVNRDGRYDAFRFSTLPNGYLNVVVFNTSPDGSFSSAKFYVDTNSSGVFNVAFSVSRSGSWVAQDPDEDGHYSAWVSLNAAPRSSDIFGGTITVGGGQMSTLHPIVQKAFTQMNNVWLAPACQGSVNGCGR